MHDGPSLGDVPQEPGPKPRSEEGQRVDKPPRASLLTTYKGAKAQTAASGAGSGRAGQGSGSLPSPRDPLRPLARPQRPGLLVDRFAGSGTGILGSFTRSRVAL